MKQEIEIFEMVDKTEEEVYFSLGLFASLKEAIEALDQFSSPEDWGSPGCFEDFARAEIHQRKMGWDDGAELVFWREYAQDYARPDDEDEYPWIVKSEGTE